MSFLTCLLCLPSWRSGCGRRRRRSWWCRWRAPSRSSWNASRSSWSWSSGRSSRVWGTWWTESKRMRRLHLIVLKSCVWPQTGLPAELRRALGAKRSWRKSSSTERRYDDPTRWRHSGNVNFMELGSINWSYCDVIQLKTNCWGIFIPGSCWFSIDIFSWNAKMGFNGIKMSLHRFCCWIRPTLF